VIDTIFGFLGRQYETLPVRHPGLELSVALVLCALAGARVAYYYSSIFRPGPLVLIGSLIALQIPLAIFLLLRRYTIGDLGLRVQGLYLIPIVMACVAPFAALIAPLPAVWRENYRQLGSVREWIELGFFTAALPEEFLRMVLQARFGAWLNNRAGGWCIATLLWALLHIPIAHQGRTLAATTYAVADILPYGLLMGYITYRSQSILPAVLLHATKFVWAGTLG
jgi:hypothetical protein